MNAQSQIEAEPETAAAAAPAALRPVLMAGASGIGAAMVLEKLLGFTANLVAARWAGPAMFGAYMLVLTTANTVAGYAGAGIGATAMRFSGEYPRGHAGYRRLLRSLAIVALLSTALAGVLTFATAGPLARILLKNAALTGLLRLAALTAAAAVLMECCRGLLVGQRLYRALVALSFGYGISLALLLPMAARTRPAIMVLAQAAAVILAVSGCLLFARKYLRPARAGQRDDAGPRVREVLRFGGVQFSAVMGVNLASWWLASMVTRADSSMAQMGFYAVGNQVRSLALLLPGIVSSASYPLLTEGSGRNFGGPHRVLVVNSFVSAAAAVLIGSGTIVVLPWALRLWGHRYVGAELAAIFLTATAIVHMSYSPAANRLHIVRLRDIGIINLVWTVLVMGLAVVLVPRLGAAGAAATLFAAFLFSLGGVCFSLGRQKEMPPEVTRLLAGVVIGTVMLVAAACWRIRATSAAAPTAVLALISFAMLGWLALFAQRQGWQPLRVATWTALLRQGLRRGQG